MLTASDLIHLPYTPDLSEAGIAFACRALASTYDRLGGYSADRLRQVAGQVALELAFRRYLSGQAIPFGVRGVTPFTRPEHYDIALGGHRCDLKSYPITRRSQISHIRRNPEVLLQAPALIPVDHFAADGQKPEDLYLFAFLLGVQADDSRDMLKALAAGQPVYLVHELPESWALPARWYPFEKLVLKSECERPVTVEIGGLDDEHNFISATLELLPRQRQLVEKGFHSLAYIHAQRRPEARIGIHCPRYGDPILIQPRAWDNLWFYGMEIVLAGWLTQDEYRRKASVLNAGRHTFQYEATPEKNLLVPIHDLNPLGRLLEKVRTWEMEKRNSLVVKAI